MMSDPRAQFRNVLKSLLEKAKQDQVNWQDMHNQTYKVKLPPAAITVDFYSPETEPDFFSANLYNSSNDIVQSITTSDTKSEDWQILSQLWKEANRSITGWDKALAEAEKAVTSSGTIGEPDIPF